MANEPRTIKGPCFDCDRWVLLQCRMWMCSCHFRDGGRAYCEQLPIKIEPDERPNVPPRMM